MATKPKKVKMYWVSPFQETPDGRAVTCFGHPATKNKAGHLVVELSPEQAKNEAKRTPAAMLTEKQYKLHQEVEAEAAAAAADEEDVEE